MAPQQLQQLPTRTDFKPPTNNTEYKDQAPGKATYDKKTEEEGEDKAEYPHYLPAWNPDEKYPPLEDFEHTEHGVGADPNFSDLLTPETTRVDLTPNIGSDIRGVQLSQLSDAGKSQLALLVAQRKVIVFRDQDFADLPIDKALDYGSFFGRHHIHPTSGAPAGYPEIHLVHRGKGDKQGQLLMENRLSTVAWHSDVTYEKQPPGTTFLYIFSKPKTGGDTIFVDQVEAYRRLSPGFRERLHGLTALHSGYEQAQAARERDSIVRREPVANIHPVVRTHPATGEKALYVNPQFTRKIIGYKKEESDAILNLLYNHISLGADFQVRVRWEHKSVIVWDNRVTAHSALLDWVNGERRHLARITPQAEKPYETPYDGKTEAEEDEKRIADLGTPILNM